MNGITIINFEPRHQEFFEMVNRSWIEQHFEMEPLDEFVLTDPLNAIIYPGGGILLAAYENVLAGAVALRKLDAKTFEFTKMGVGPGFRRRGIAEALCYSSFVRAKELGATKVILYSNSVLEGAVQLYEKVGFSHLPPDNQEYKRSDIKMEIDIFKAIKNANKYYSELEKLEPWK